MEPPNLVFKITSSKGNFFLKIVCVLFKKVNILFCLLGISQFKYIGQSQSRGIIYVIYVVSWFFLSLQTEEKKFRSKVWYVFLYGQYNFPKNQAVCLYNKCLDTWLKNPAYGRQSISRPMRIVAPIPQ